MKWTQKKRPNTVLGLTLDGGRLDAVVLRRTNGSVEVLKTVSAPLTLDLLHNETVLVGREIHNLLEAAGVRERRCVVGIPLGWSLTLHTKLPALEPADVPSFLEIEAERGFPCNVDELQVATTQHTSPGGEAYATQIGVPRGHLARLEAVLAAAQLKPLSFSLGIAALPGALPEGPRSAITILVGDESVDLLLGSGGGLVALRALEGAFDTAGPEKRIQSEGVARELRITLGQLPADIRDSLRQIHVIGSSRFAQTLTEEIRPRAKSLGLTVDQVTSYAGPQHGVLIPSGVAVSSAASLAAQFLGNRGPVFEFLAPKPGFFQQLSTRYSSKRLAWAGASAAAAAIVVGGLFTYQQIQLSGLNSDWQKMKSKVTELDELQAQIRKYRPWYDESMTAMSIMRAVTESFPEDGVVSAKTIEIRNISTVNCSGTARDNQALLRTVNVLKASKQIGDVRMDTIRGKPPLLQFTFNFRWGAVAKP